MEIGHKGLTVNHAPREKGPGQSLESFTEAMQARLETEYKKKYPPEHTGKTYQAEDLFSVPPGYSDSYDHFHNFFDAVRSRQPVVEDATFGFRAAGAALLSNLSYQRDAVVHWDPEAMKLL
jgi:hypothetical protein